jgi:selenocysteine lyase/cysteine desulfurase
MHPATSHWRDQFSNFGGCAYLDCAAQGPFPNETAAEVRRSLRLKEHPEEIQPGLFEEMPARARVAVARLIGCNPTSIALGAGASHGINIAAHGLPLERGDEVLLPEGEFPANLYPWLNLERDGIKVREVPPSSGRAVEAADLIQALGPRTRILSVSLVAYATGYRIDLHALSEACRRRGVFLVVDGAQGIGAVDFRVADYGIDILAVSGYKWLFGPYGSGFTYVNPRILDCVRVLDVNWYGVEGAAHLNRRSTPRLQFREGAGRFDIPETASFLNLAAFTASVSFLNRVRVSTVEAHVRRLLDQLLRGVERTRLRPMSTLTPSSRSSILSLEASSVDETRTIYRRLRDKGIIVSLRSNLIRVSPNIYNGPEEIDRLLAAAAE